MKQTTPRITYTEKELDLYSDFSDMVRNQIQDETGFRPENFKLVRKNEKTFIWTFLNKKTNKIDNRESMDFDTFLRLQEAEEKIKRRADLIELILNIK